MLILAVETVFLVWNVKLCPGNQHLSTLKRSESGKIYAKKLANFVEKRLKNEKAASVSISDC